MEDALPGKRFKILIADDDVDLLEMLEDIFTADGMEVVTATDGVDAELKYAQQGYDAVITDIKMPRKSGLKLVEHIRTQEKGSPGGGAVAPIPILLVSASVDEYRSEIEGLSDVVTIEKPFRPVEALSKVREVLGGSKTAAFPSETVHFRAGDFVMREGDLTTEIFYVKSGHLRVTKKGPLNTDVTICTVGAGEIVGELGFLLHKPRSASVVAVLDSELVPIPKEKFDRIFTDQPKWFKMLFETIAARLEDTTEYLVKERSKTKT